MNQSTSPLLYYILCISFWSMGFSSFGQQNYEWVFQVDYDRVSDFTNGRAIVQQGLKKGFIDKEGKEVVAPQFTIIDAYSEGVASAGFSNFKQKDTQSGFIDREGNFVIDRNYEVTSPMNQGYACVKYRDLWGYIRSNGKWVLLPKFEEANLFKDGYAAVKSHQKWGVINTKGEFIIGNDYDYILSISNDLFACKKGKKWGYLNINGIFEIPPTFDAAYSFKNGTAVIEKNGKMGIINLNGNYIIEPIYTQLRNFSYQLAAAEQDGKWGFLTPSGEWLIAPQYEKADSFSEGLARVKIKGKWGYIDTNGELVISPNFDKAYSFQEGLARVYQDEIKGFIRYIPPLPPETTADKINAAPEEMTARNIKSGTSLKVKGQSLTIKIFDYKKVDGDIVSLNHNGKWILKEHTLSKEPLEFKITLDANSSTPNYLMLYALNLGTNPPNTAQLSIIDEEKQQEVILESDMESCDIIYFE